MDFWVLWGILGLWAMGCSNCSFYIIRYPLAIKHDPLSFILYLLFFIHYQIPESLCIPWKIKIPSFFISLLILHGDKGTIREVHLTMNIENYWIISVSQLRIKKQRNNRFEKLTKARCEIFLKYFMIFYFWNLWTHSGVADIISDYICCSIMKLGTGSLLKRTTTETYYYIPHSS